MPVGPQVVVGREDPYSGVYPDVDLSPHGAEEERRLSPAPAHRPGRWPLHLEDLNSTNYTYLNRHQVQPGVAVDLRDGDEIALAGCR